MKVSFKHLGLGLVLICSLYSCRDQEEKDTKTIEGVEVSDDAEIEVSDDGEKIEIEDGDTEVKIKKDEDGNIEKKKIETEEKEVKVKMEDGEVVKRKVDQE
ncbi:hypothetical protein ACFSQ0_00015 [Mesonia sediminis]|jgi:hypothetical protein|uniref:Membrane or secreted protein n=1 Tax=Mesonia sediminis TaxID=1703946 RepID=A0ABW5S9Z6_9FLAO